MIFLLFLEVATALIFALFMLKQIIIPAFQGRKLFPMFTKVSALEDEEVEVKQAQYEKQKAKSINTMKKGEK